MNRFTLLLLFLLVGLLVSSHCVHANTYTYPDNSLVVDVTQPPWNVDNSGTVDVTTNIQAIIDTYKYDAQQVCPYIIYFPTGTYLVSKSLIGSTEDGGSGQGWIIIQGESRENTIIKLKDNCDGSGDTENFTDSNNPRAVIDYFTGNWSNNAFINVLENLTIDVGSGNYGAIGVHFFDNNCGCVRELTIRPSGVNPVGTVGLSTALRGPNGIGFISNVDVFGFQKGIDFSQDISYMAWVMEDIVLSGQTVCGIDVLKKSLSIRRLVSTNTVPAVRINGRAALVCVLDSKCVGGEENTAAIHMDSGSVFARNITVSGYTSTVYDAEHGGYITHNLSDNEYVSGSGARLWDSTPYKSLNLPVIDTPTVAWDASNNWAIVDVNAQYDDTEAVRAAMESGKSTVAFTPGECKLTDTVVIGKNVRRILGQWARLKAEGTMRKTTPPMSMFRLEDSNHDTIVFEKFDAMWSYTNLNVYLMHHAGNADLVMKDIFFPEGTGYRNDPVAGGRVFVENVHTIRGSQIPITNDPAWTIVNQEMYARQLNPEMLMPHVINDGGRVWVMGFKFGEFCGPVVHTKKHGETELLGGIMNMTCDDFPPPPQQNLGMIEIDNGRASAVILERCTWDPYSGGNGWGFHSNVVIETRGAETRRVIHRADGYRPWSNHWFSVTGITNRADEHGAFVPLFAGYPPANAGNTPPSFPIISATDTVTFPDTAMMRAATSDTDGPLSTVIRWKKYVGDGQVLFSDPTETNTTVEFTRPGVYSISATASDGLSETTTYTTIHSVFETPWNAPFRAEGRINDIDEDGKGESVNDWALRIGEPWTSGAQTEYRTQFDFDIRAMSGMTNAIESVTLWITPKSFNGSAPDINLYLVDSYGIIETGDFSRAGILAASTNAATLAQNTPIGIPCTDVIVDALAEGKVSVGLRLQRQTNQGGMPHYVELYKSTDTPVSYQPHLTFTPSAPSTPVNLTTTQVTQTAISLQWNEYSDNESAIILERRIDTTGVWYALDFLPPSVTEYTDTSLPHEDVTYYYRVALTNAVGVSDYSNEAHAFPLPEPHASILFFATWLWRSLI